MDASHLLPRVVHREYFAASGLADPATEPERFGFLRSIGHDVYSFLCCADGQGVRNVHQEHLDELKMTVEEAGARSMDNLRSIAFDGRTIQQRVTKAKNGSHWSVWIGNDFTSSCLVLPELYSWSCKQLGATSFLVSVPSTQLLFILPAAASVAISGFDEYVATVVQESENLVSPEWFQLDANGLAPWNRGTHA